MNRALLVCLSLLAHPFAIGGCASAPPPGPSAASPSQNRVYEVFGMDCPGCHGGIEKLVLKIPGVQGAKANWEKKRLEVIIEPGATVSDDAVQEAVQKANFTVGKRLQ